MPPSNDIDLQPDLAHLTLSNPAKAKSVDITKLRIDGPNALGASSQADLFMTRKKPVVRRTLEELAASGRSDMDQANDSASATPNTTSFSFTSPVEGKVASSTVGKFPNLTNSALYVGPDYGRRDILAASPNPPPHCKDKEAEDKCLVCLLHDFKSPMLDSRKPRSELPTPKLSSYRRLLRLVTNCSRRRSSGKASATS